MTIKEKIAADAKKQNVGTGWTTKKMETALLQLLQVVL